MAKLQGGTKAQIAAVLEAGLIPKIIDALANADFDVKKEAAWAISNATTGGTPEQIRYLVGQQCIRPLCGMLTVQDSRIINVAMEVRPPPFSYLRKSSHEMVGGRGSRTF